MCLFVYVYGRVFIALIAVDGHMRFLCLECVIFLQRSIFSNDLLSNIKYFYFHILLKSQQDFFIQVNMFCFTIAIKSKNHL